MYGDKLRTELGQCPNRHKESKLSLLMLDRNLGEICRRSLTPVEVHHTFTLNLTRCFSTEGLHQGSRDFENTFI